MFLYRDYLLHVSFVVFEYVVSNYFVYFYCISFNSQRLRPTIHEIITTKIKAHAENASRPRIGQAAQAAITGLHYLKGQLEGFQSSKQKHQNGIYLAVLLAVSPVSPVMAPTGTAQAAAKELLDSILDAVVHIFGKC